MLFSFLLFMPLLDPLSIVNMHYDEITRFVKHRKDALLMPLRDSLSIVKMCY